MTLSGLGPGKSPNQVPSAQININDYPVYLDLADLKRERIGWYPSPDAAAAPLICLSPLLLGRAVACGRRLSRLDEAHPRVLVQLEKHIGPDVPAGHVR